MADRDTDELLRGQLSRRGILKCMTWAGTGVLWTLSGGMPRSIGLVDEASAAPPPAGAFTFLQISDSHVGFDKPANPNALGTLQEAIAKINAMPVQPSFIIHTGDISHLSKDKEFDDADQAIKMTNKKIFFVPGEHDMLDDENGKAYLQRYGKETKGAGWYSFDQHGIHFIGLVNVVNLEAGGLGNLGDDQLEWLEQDVSVLSPILPSTSVRWRRATASTSLQFRSASCARTNRARTSSMVKPRSRDRFTNARRFTSLRP